MDSPRPKHPPRSASLTIGQFATTSMTPNTASSPSFPFGFVQLDDEPKDTSMPKADLARHARAESSSSARRSRSQGREGQRPPSRQKGKQPLTISVTPRTRPGGHGPASASSGVEIHSPTTPMHSRSASGSRTGSRPPSRSDSRPRTSGRPRRGTLHAAPNTPRQIAQFISSAAASIAPPSIYHPQNLQAKPGMGWRAWRLIKPWLPLLAYGATSLGFVIAVAFWKTQVFTGLDHLASYLKTDGWAGYLVLYSLIVVTTIPPVPLYSTLIILSGYTFGAIKGFIVSYSAALSGALMVFLISRFVFKDSISRWFSQFIYLKRVVRAIERRPKLLFLIRVAPYPYNVMNCLLASSPFLTWQTYTLCTALSLFKLIIHTSVGGTIHSFSRHYLDKSTPTTGGGNNSTIPAEPEPAPEPEEKSSLTTISTVVGIILCVAIFLYLSYVARKAVDEELGDDTSSDARESGETDAEERAALIHADADDVEARMSMSSVRSETVSRSRPSREMASSPFSQPLTSARELERTTSDERPAYSFT